MIVSREQDPGAEWDTFVRRQAGWTICHLSAWHGLMRDVFGHECLYMVARRDDSSMAAILPLVRVKSAVYGHYLMSMPFLNYGGPLGDSDAVGALIEQAVANAARDNVKLLQLRSRQSLPTDLSVSHHKITVTLELPENGPDSLWRSFDA